jgi:cytosine deaminase
MNTKSDLREGHLNFMKAAIEEAKLGLRENGIPIGSVLVKDDKIIARGHNMRVQKNDPTLHAEIACLRNAGRIGSYSGTTVYSTLMPCYLCAGAVVQFEIRKVVVGESENFAGAKEFMQQHGVEVTDLNLDECKEILREFIRDNRRLWDEDIGRL